MPPGLSGDELLETVLRQVLDHVNLHAMACRAVDADGNPVPPPDAQVFAHAAELADEEDLLRQIP